MMTLQQTAQVAQIISTAAISISAFVALVVFIYTRRANRRRATLDMVMKTFLDPDGRKRYQEFKSLVRKDKDALDPFQLTDLAERTDRNADDFEIMKSQLNDYELVSLGIHRGVFDEQFYKLWFHRQFTKDYEAVADLVAKIQHGSPSTFCEFKRLNDRWQKNRHPAAHPGRFTKAYWALTGKDRKLKAVLNGK